MIARTSALLVVVTLAGCQWEGRPDGAEANHSASDGYYETEAAPQASPLGGTAGAAEITEPLDAADFGVYRGASATAPGAIAVEPAPTEPEAAPAE